ncbi:MAG: alpha/beta fold hydrolase, partial [Halobacteriaceae archaeon]
MSTIRTNDIKTNYEKRGHGKPIIFIHGAIVDHHQWEPQINELSSDYRVYAYDVRGHGLTGGSTKESYTIDLFADDLDAFIDALDIDQPILCGL